MLMARSAGPFSREDASAAAGGEAVIAALQGENALLRSEITLLMARIAELERRLGLNSSNSGKAAVQRRAKEAGPRQEPAATV